MKLSTAPSGVRAKSDYETQQLLQQREIKKRPVLAEKWRKQVDEIEERKVMEILKPFHIDAYKGGDVLPTKWL